MLLRIALAAAITGVLATPAASADTVKEQRMRQMSEVVFKNYPPRALAAGEQGAVFFVVTLDDKAHPKTCDVTHSSGHPLLDQETCAMIVRHGVFKQVIGPNGKLKQSTHEGVVNWRIPGAPTVAVKAIPVTANTKPDKQICKRTLRTGTLGAWERTCMTQREWDLARQETRDFWGETRNKGTTNGN